MELFPAIDIRGGHVVRLLRGDYQQETRYEMTPLAAAREFAAQGAKNLHVVDLDGAKDGQPANFDAIAEIAAQSGLFLEVGGGVRDAARLRDYLAAGAGRVILGTAAVRDPALVRRLAAEYGPQLAVGVDARDGRVAVAGWRELTALDSVSFCEQLAADGVRTVIYTDIARDGALCGVEPGLYARLQQIPGLAVVASGGVSSLEDIRRLAALELSGAIIGRALYDGRLSLPAALAAAAAAANKGEEAAKC